MILGIIRSERLCDNVKTCVTIFSVAPMSTLMTNYKIPLCSVQ